MNRIKDLRVQKGMNQKELATALGIAQPTLSGWETGRTQIDYDNLEKIKKYFNVSLDYLLCFSDIPNAEAVAELPVIKPELLALAEQIQSLPPEMRDIIERQVKVYADMDKK